MKNPLPHILSRNSRFHIPLLSVALGLALLLGGCTSSRAGIAHNYDSPFGNGTVYVEGSSHPGPHRAPRPPKPPKHKKAKPKKPKKQKAPKKHDKHHDHRPGDHHGHR